MGRGEGHGPEGRAGDDNRQRVLATSIGNKAQEHGSIGQHTVNGTLLITKDTRKGHRLNNRINMNPSAERTYG